MQLFEKTLSRDIKFEGKVFTAAKDRAELCDKSIADREIVIHHGGAGILPINSKGEVTLVRQYRYGAGKVLDEICAGKMEAGEKPLDCALRELSEELGLEAQNVVSLGEIYATPAYCSEKIYIYLATELTQSAAHPDEGEFLEKITLPLDVAVEKVLCGEITDSKTQIALLKAERMLRGKD